MKLFFFIEKSFRRLVKAAKLGEFWKSILRHYREDVKPHCDKILYIIRARKPVSRRRFEHVYAYYAHAGRIPSLSPGRKRKRISYDEERIILEAYSRHRVGAIYLKNRTEADSGIRINHDRISRVLKMKSSDPNLREVGQVRENIRTSSCM